MPYTIQEMQGEYCVCTPDGQPIDGGCHATKAEAENHMQAMYANVPDASMEAPTRVRLNLISEVAYSADSPSRPIHMFKPGTFTDMTGRESSFSDADVRAIVAHFEATKRRKPPITERHDWGRAIGRIQNVWADPAGNLYGTPKWNAEGRRLLADEVYDGFSCELEKNGGGWALIGGSLTNYPAVSGLEPVTLEAPSFTEAPTMPAIVLAAPPAPVPARPDTPSQPPKETPIMAEQLEQAVLPEVEPPPPISDPTMQARLDAYVAQINARYEQQQQQALAQASAEFERRMREMEQRSSIEAFARQRTVTTADQPYAIPATADQLTQLLLETPAAVRGKWQALLSQMTTSGLLSFDEIGSAGDGGESADQWFSLVASYQAKGMNRVEAIKAAAKAHPALYDAQQYAKKGGR